MSSTPAAGPTQKANPRSVDTQGRPWEYVEGGCGQDRRALSVVDRSKNTLQSGDESMVISPLVSKVWCYEG